MSFQNMLSVTPTELQNEITEMDKFLKSLRPLKFKRTVDKRKINYVSPVYGVSYAILPLSSESSQHFGWYYLYDKENKKWYRKTDYFEATIAEIAKTAPQTAKHIFNAINECTTCKGSPCSAISYMYDGNQKLSCYGRIVLGVYQSDFNHAQEFFRQLNKLVQFA